MSPDPAKIAEKYSRTGSPRTAGEVRFIKDRGSDHAEWGWGSPGPSERAILPNFVFNAKYLKPLAQSMRSSLMALGHMISSYNAFTRIKSRNISPDGNLGGQGYIQKIPDMRRQLMNCIEALSSYTDTVYDELSAPHWNPSEDTLDPRDREEVKEIVEEAEEIREDPEGWAASQPEEVGKTASGASLQDCVEDVLLKFANLRLLQDAALRTESPDAPLKARAAAHQLRLSSATLERVSSSTPSADPVRVASLYARRNNV